MDTPDPAAPFDWDTDESIVVRGRRATAVYPNQFDHVVILQEGLGGLEDQVITVHPDDIPRLITALKTAAAEAKG